MMALPLILTLKEPVLAPALAGDPNSVTSFPFIPGSAIRGALVARYLEQHPGVEVAQATEPRQLFFEGRVRFLNAYPLAENGRRTLPTPFNWVIKKGAELPSPIYDLAGNGARPDQVRGLAAPYYWPAQQTVELYRPLRQFNVHTRRENRVMGRAGEEDDGNVFRYEALAAGQQFGSVILLDKPADQAVMAALLPESMLLGASRLTGYGRVTLDAEPVVEAWREMPDPAQAIPAGRPFRLVLLSDLLVKAGNGQVTLELPLQALAEQLEAKTLTLVKSFRETGLAAGFNQKWGLPLPQSPVLRAGSVFVLKASAEISLAAIRRLEDGGLGLRRTEGFGRVAIVAGEAQAGLAARKAAVKSGPLSQALPAGLQARDHQDSRALAKTLSTRLWQHHLEGSLAGYLNDLRLSPNGLKPSQPNRLRLLVRSLLARPGASKAEEQALVKAVEAWLAELRSPARRQFEAAQVNGEPLLDWIEAQLKAPNEVWKLLKVESSSFPHLNLNEAGLEEISAGLEIKLALRLIDSVLARLAKEAKGRD